MRNSIKLFLIVSVILTAAFWVLYWMRPGFLLPLDESRFEKLELKFLSGYTDMDDDGNFNILLSVRNRGWITAKIGSFVLNGNILSYWNDIVSQNITGAKLMGGESICATIRLRKGSEWIGRSIDPEWISGAEVNIKITTAAGNEYEKSVVLP